MKKTHKIVALFAGAALLVALVAVVSFWAFSQIEKAAEARKHSDVVINRANDVLSALRDAETGQRGYSLTGDEAFLEPYLAVRDSVRDHLKELRQITLISAAINTWTHWLHWWMPNWRKCRMSLSCAATRT